MITTAHDAINAILALYAEPGAWTAEGVAQDAAGRETSPTGPDAVAWSPEGALYRFIGDPEEEGITEAEWRCRLALISDVFEACGADLAALADAARDRRPVVAVLRAGLNHAGA